MKLFLILVADVWGEKCQGNDGTLTFSLTG